MSLRTLVGLAALSLALPPAVNAQESGKYIGTWGGQVESSIEFTPDTTLTYCYGDLKKGCTANVEYTRTASGVEVRNGLHRWTFDRKGHGYYAEYFQNGEKRGIGIFHGPK